MAIPDALYLAFIATGFWIDHFVVWRAFVRRSRTDLGRARAELWSRWIVLLWTLAGAGVALWIVEARGWEALRLIPPHRWRLWIASALVAALAGSYARRIARIARSTRGRRVKIACTADVERLLPHSVPELRRWLAVSLSAGLCEEFVFRGYLIWAFQPLLGVWGAAALSVGAFAAAHSYQGAKGVLATGTAGTAFTVVVLALGSLLPAMALHAIVDIGEGLAAWLVVARAPTDRTSRPAPS
jgi:CAAX protease family protein